MGRRAALAACIAALFALAFPSLASANWIHKGKGELKENASVTLSGELTLSTSAGNVTCPTTIGTTLTGSSTAGHVNSFTVSEPSKNCDLTGSLATICGTKGLTKVEKTGTWALAADETDITLSSIDIHYTLAGCLIPGFRLKGSATMSLDKANGIEKATFSGTQTLYDALGKETGTGSLEGTLTASPAGTYGVKTEPVEWYTDELIEEEELEVTLGTTTATGDLVELSGILSWTRFPLRQTCSTHAEAKLWNHETGGGVHTATGEIESFVMTSPCTVGIFNAVDMGYTDIPGCEISETASGEPPWHINVTEASVDIEGTNFTITYQGCSAIGIPNGTKFGFSGTLTGTWNNASGCVEYSNSGDIESPSKEPFPLDGSLCSSSLTLK